MSSFPSFSRATGLVAGFVAMTAFAAPAAAGWSPYYASPRGGFDRGGYVSEYFDQVATANSRGESIEISGTCASACTMKLGARNVCVYRDAELWFHAAHNNGGGFNALGTRIMLRQYPSRIRHWVMSRGAVASNAFTTMSGATAIALGVRDCAHARIERTVARSARFAQRAPVQPEQPVFGQTQPIDSAILRMW